MTDPATTDPITARRHEIVWRFEIMRRLDLLRSALELQEGDIEGLANQAMDIAVTARRELLDASDDSDGLLLGQLYRIVGALETLQTLVHSVIDEIGEGPMGEKGDPS